MAVPAHHLAALGIGGISAGPALVHGVAHVIVDPDGQSGVTGDPAHGLGADQAVAFELTGEGRRLARGVDEGAEGDVEDHEVRARRGGPGP